jgi:hypothetical protein
MCLICKGLPGYTVTRSHGPMECGRRRIEREKREKSLLGQIGLRRRTRSRCKLMQDAES